VTWLKTLPDESVDLVVTDYAYESLEKHRATGTTTRLKVSDGSSNEWFEIFRNVRVPGLLTELFRVMKKDSHLYMISDQETMIDVVRPMGRAAGFTFWKSIAWVKTKGKAAEIDLDADLTADQVKIGMGYHWRNSKEEVSFLEKGKRKLNFLGWPDVLPAPRVDRGCQCEKPTWISSALLGEGLAQTQKDTSRSSAVGDSNSSMSSCGSGTTDPSPAGSTSTTGTRTREIGGLRTSNSSPSPTTRDTTPSPVNSGVGLGGNAALSVVSSNPLTTQTGTSPSEASNLGHSHGADPATPGTPSNASSDDVCVLCGRTRKPWPTEKPVSLLSKLIENSSSPGELVIDPFMGSGSCGEAALRLGRNFAGCDLSDRALQTARARLARLGTEVALPLRDTSFEEMFGVSLNEA
jgi:site-specific DNA-methyltransferase (adenine-specific)